MTNTGTLEALPELPDDWSVSVYGSKYEVHYNHRGTDFYASRYGERWRELSGDNLVYFLAAELAQYKLRDEAVSHNTELDKDLIVPNSALEALLDFVQNTADGSCYMHAIDARRVLKRWNEAALTPAPAEATCEPVCKVCKHTRTKFPHLPYFNIVFKDSDIEPHEFQPDEGSDDD